MMDKPAVQSAPVRKASDPVVAKASTEYRVKRLIIVVMLIGMGGWFGYDGLVKWPGENKRLEELNNGIKAAVKTGDENQQKKLQTEIDTEKLKMHSETDLRWQRILASVLPPIGLLVLGWSLYSSRGVYRLRDNLLNIPGHPPIPLDAIRSIDKTYWDRKGIARVHYELINGAKGIATLDDFIYERAPTDEIFKRIEDYTGTGDAAAPPAA